MLVVVFAGTTTDAEKVLPADALTGVPSAVVQLLLVKSRTVVLASAVPVTVGVVLDDGDPGTDAVTDGDSGLVLSCTNVKVFEQIDTLLAASVAVARKSVAVLAVTDDWIAKPVAPALAVATG